MYIGVLPMFMWGCQIPWISPANCELPCACWEEQPLFLISESPLQHNWECIFKGMSKFSSWPQKILHAIVQLKISPHDPFQLFNDVLVIGFPWISGTFQSLSPSGPLWLQHLPRMFFPMLAVWRILPELLDFNKVSWSSDVPACLKYLTAVLRGPCYQHRIETLFSLMGLNVYHFLPLFPPAAPTLMPTMLS